MKIAFVHIMKTAGSTVTRALNKSALLPYHYLRLDPGNYRENDWSDGELQSFLDWDSDRLYVQNHAKNWAAPTISEYVKRGWFTFSFYRHPGDQWCSYYFWSKDMKNERLRKQMAGRPKAICNDLALDEFLGLGWSDNSEPQSRYMHVIPDLRKNLDLPECWRAMNFVDIYSNQNFQIFLKKYFGIRDWNPTHTNTSANRGYQYYRQLGLISDTTHELLMASERYSDYRSLLEKPHERGREQFLSAKTNPFFSRRQRMREPIRYVILLQGCAGSRLLTEPIRNHPNIQDFEEEFDTFPQTWANQKKWLRNFFVRLPKKDRSIRVLGFATKLTSISNTSRFREFLQHKQIRVIYLAGATPCEPAGVGDRDLHPNKQRGDKKMLEPDNAKCKTDGSGLKEYLTTLNVPKLGLDHERLSRGETVELNRLWKFLGVGPIASTT